MRREGEAYNKEFELLNADDKSAEMNAELNAMGKTPEELEMRDIVKEQEAYDARALAGHSEARFSKAQIELMKRTIDQGVKKYELDTFQPLGTIIDTKDPR
jgi:hypothetical protein